MPNWVTLTLHVRGDATALAAFRDAVRSEAKEGNEASGFSFSRIIPMPPELSVEDSTSGKMGMAAIVGSDVECRRYYHFARDADIQTPTAFLAWLQANNPQALEIGQRYIDNIESHGAATWYDWSIQHWGTKWDACDVEVEALADTELKISFQTAWSFPEPIFAHLAQAYPTLKFEGSVDEEGGYFYGEFSAEDGELTLDFKEGTRAGGPYDYGDDEGNEGDD